MYDWTRRQQQKPPQPPTSVSFWTFLLLLLLIIVLPNYTTEAKIRFPLSDLFAEAMNSHNNNNRDVNTAGGASVNAGGTNIPDTSPPSSSTTTTSSSPISSNDSNGSLNSLTSLTDLEDMLLRLWETYTAESSILRDFLVKYPKQVLHFVWYNIILYKPPVGIVTAWTLTKLVTSGRIFQIQQLPFDAMTTTTNPRSGGRGENANANNAKDPNYSLDDTSERVLHKASKSRLDRHKGRALDLDQDDMMYKKYGGIERVRRRLASSALGCINEDEESKLPKNDRQNHQTHHTIIPFQRTRQQTEVQKRTALHEMVNSLDNTLKVAFPPGGSHAEHVQEMIQPLAEAEAYALELGLLPPNANSGGSTVVGGGIIPKKIPIETERLLRIGLQTAEMCVLDSMLRLTRDRLLRTSFRLSRTVKFWKRRVQSHNTLTNMFAPLIRSFVQGGVEGDRMRLAFAEAAYKAELKRMGKVLRLLDQRPGGMDDSYLQAAVQKTLWEDLDGPPQEDTFTRALNATMGSGSFVKKHLGGLFSFLPSSWTFPPKNHIAGFALRYNADGRGRFSFQTFENSVQINGKSATQVLLDDFPNTQQPWLDKAQIWTLEARSLIYDTIRDALETSVQPTLAQEQELAKFQATWRTQQYNANAAPTESILNQWQFVYEMVRDINRLRRIGEGKSLKLKEVNFIHWLQQWDLMGLPSAALKIYLANLLNQKLQPYFPKFKAIVDESFDTMSEIIMTRFWTPFKDLVDELMHRDTKRLLTGVSLDDEATSLDFMLRDLGFGDGTPATRHEAMLKATRQYESDMNTGLMRHALGGRLVRLMLIQVQQLKVGMLDAAETIDVLFQSNRLNMQLLAIIPAIVIVGVGTKLLTRFLFTVRVKDLRPMSSVHAEMTEYLNELEYILLLSNRTPDQERATPASEVLQDHQLAEFALTLYDYLVLLDYSSPQPFPNWQCDAIHQSIAEFFGRNGSINRLTLNDQIRLLDLVKCKHQELSKYL